MTEFDSPSPKEFQRKLYQDLDNKLKSSPWNSGVSEAHGLLAGLACRGVSTREVVNKMYLFQVSEADEISMLEGLFELILRDLDSDELTFNPLLPDDPAGTFQKADELSNWCEGYIQGFCHDNEAIINQSSESVQEIVNDLFEIGGMNLTSVDGASEEDERSLIEIEEFLRVGIQLIYDEMVSNSDTGTNKQSIEMH